MGLKLLKDADGKPRASWYGRISVKGRLVTQNLNVPIEGVIPLDGSGNPALSVKGDAVFERSRKAAQKAFERWRKETQKDPAELAAKAYHARTGVSVEGVPLANLADLWKTQKRTYTPTADWCAAVRKWFERFAAFAHKYAADHGTKCETINDVTPEIAGAWFDDIKGEFAWETVTKQMSLMRGAFRRYATSGKPNPFDDVVVRNRETGNARVNRKPLTATEAQRLFDCARDNDAVYPLIVCAACTGMRIGDVCRLRWADVDLRGGLIDVLTAKTGKRVTIPIFERLREVLDERNAIAGDGTKPTAFVFPAAAAWYARNPDGVYQAAKPYFAKAVFGDAPEPTDAVLIEDGNGEAEPRALADAIEGAGFTDEKRKRVLDVYARFKAGARCIDIAAALGVARSQVSMDLRDAERLTGENLRPRSIAKANRATRLDLIGRTRAARGVGKRAASLYGWHSLRATFVVLAVEAGVPLPDIQKIVGHSTSTTTLEYFNPTAKHTAERVRKQMSGTVLDGRRNRGKAIDIQEAAALPDASAVAPVARQSVDALIAGLTDDQRKELARKLLGL